MAPERALRTRLMVFGPRFAFEEASAGAPGRTEALSVVNLQRSGAGASRKIADISANNGTENKHIHSPGAALPAHLQRRKRAVAGAVGVSTGSGVHHLSGGTGW